MTKISSFITRIYCHFYFYRFGDALPEDGLVGYLVQAKPIHACTPIAPPNNTITPPPGIHWIAIIRDNPDRWYNTWSSINYMSLVINVGFLSCFSWFLAVSVVFEYWCIEKCTLLCLWRCGNLCIWFFILYWTIILV